VEGKTNGRDRGNIYGGIKGETEEGVEVEGGKYGGMERGIEERFKGEIEGNKEEE
jgi:hypothetical protein